MLGVTFASGAAVPAQPAVVVADDGTLGLDFGPLGTDDTMLSLFAGEHLTPDASGSSDGSPMSSPLNADNDTKLAIDLGLGVVDSPFLDDFTQLYTDLEADLIELSTVSAPPPNTSHTGFGMGLTATLAPAAPPIPRAPPATPARGAPVYSRPAFTPRSNPYATLGLAPGTPTSRFPSATPKAEPSTPSPPGPVPSPLLDPQTSLVNVSMLCPPQAPPLTPTPTPPSDHTSTGGTTTKGKGRDGAVIPPRGRLPDGPSAAVSPSAAPGMSRNPTGSTTVIATPETPVHRARGESSDSTADIDPKLLYAPTLSPPIALATASEPVTPPQTPQWRWINYTEADADFLMTGVAPSGGRGASSRHKYEDGTFSDEDEYDPAAHSPTPRRVSVHRTPRTPGRSPRKPSTVAKTPRTPSVKCKTPAKAPKTPRTPRRASRK